VESLIMPPSDEKAAAPYPPAPFLETRADVLIAALREITFGHLITAGPDGPLACGAPFVVTETPEGPNLEAHLARPNPQSRQHGAPALILFQGPHAYVRPAWYPAKRVTGRVVPTWNYITVQARGVLEVIEDPDRLLTHLHAVSAHKESAFRDPWSPDDAPADYIAGLARGIVGLRLRVTSLEGVWKLSQNHPEGNRLGVIAGLNELSPEGAHPIARAMDANERERGG
jgi:transcriptional regulator